MSTKPIFKIITKIGDEIVEKLNEKDGVELYACEGVNPEAKVYIVKDKEVLFCIEAIDINERIDLRIISEDEY